MCTEGGRCVRPVIIIDKGNVSRFTSEVATKNATWTDLVNGVGFQHSIVEYIDVEESNSAMIAMRESDLRGTSMSVSASAIPSQYTHMELHASLMFGVLAGSIPFSDHNQAPRNCYQAAMGKQAIGVYTSNYQSRYDTLGHVLDYPQKPIIQTKMAKIVNNDQLPCGMNVMVAIMTYTGYNQEDSVMLNHSAVDRGMFKSTHYRTYKEQNNKNHSTGEEEFFCDPTMQATKALKPFNYGKLNPDGFVPENTYVESGDVIIGKCMPQKTESTMSNKDTSVVLKNNENGFVDKICNHDPNHVNVNGDGYTFAKVRIRSERIPCIGDKFCVPGHTEVLVEHVGWTPIKDLFMVAVRSGSGSIKVLQIDELGNASFAFVIAQYSFDASIDDDKLMHFAGPNVDMYVTSEHKMFVKEAVDVTLPIPDGIDIFKDFKLKRAIDMKGNETFLKGCKSMIFDAVCPTPKYQFMDLNDIAFLYGVFMYRGFVDGPYYTKLIYFKEVADIIADYGISWKIDSTGRYMVICDEDIYQFFCDVQNCIGVQPWIYNQPYSDRFIEGLFCMDESATFSKEIADAIQIVGINARMCVDIEKHVENPRAYTVKLAPIVTCKYSVTTVAYTGKVYCIEVPSHVFMTRSQGKCVWTGNSSRHGQKGTVGMLYRQEDLPFTRDGTVPDIIVNPHAIPSRMTIAQLMECIMGKAATAHGTFGDATPFTDIGVNDIASALELAGLEKHGNEIMYNPRTGEQIQTDIFIGPTYYQRLKHMVFDKVHCTRSDHDILTQNGWKPIADITMDDEVATLVDDKLVYTKPTAVLHFPNYKGKMYAIKNQAIDLDVTIGHRMYVSRKYGRAQVWQPYKLTKAEDLVGKFARYKKDVEWDVPDYQFVLPAAASARTHYEDRIVNMDSWLTFFGIWIAEGCANNGENTKDSEYKTQIAVHKPRVKEVIFDAIEKLGLTCSVHKNNLVIRNKQLHAYMAPLSVGALKKRLPEWAWKLSKIQCQKLIHAMQLGDGSWKTTGSMYYTSSVGLRDDFQRLCFHAGWASMFTEHIPMGQTTIIRGKEVTNNAIVWRCSLIKTRINPNVNHGHVYEQHVQEERVYDFEGPVYCLQVPSEVFYVRRNGKACWTGNSRSNNGPIVLLTRQPAEGRARDGGLRLGEMEVECLWSHGASSFLKERFMECSDNYRVHVCKKCGMMANVNPENKIYYCKPCNNRTMFAEIRIPYASKLLFQEIATMSIGTRFLT